MANNSKCGDTGRRGCNKRYGCLNSMGGRYCWDSFPYYPGPCPDENGDYGCACGDERSCRGECGNRNICGQGGGFGMFTAMMPLAVAANGIVPLANTGCICNDDAFKVNFGMITLKEEGTYLATYTVRVPEGEELESTFTLDVNNASQASAVTMVGGSGPSSYTAQAIFDAGDQTTLALKTSEAINVTRSAMQPLVTLSLVRLE